MYTHARVCAHTCMHMCVSMGMCVFTCMCADAYMCVCSCEGSYVEVSMSMYFCVCSSTFLPTYFWSSMISPDAIFYIHWVSGIQRVSCGSWRSDHSPFFFLSAPCEVRVAVTQEGTIFPAVKSVSGRCRLPWTWEMGYKGQVEIRTTQASGQIPLQLLDFCAFFFLP